MPKIIPAHISKNERGKLKKLLSQKLTKINTPKEMSNFLEDLLTESEFVMIVRRLQTAKMLLDECTYFEIRQELGVSYETIKIVRTNLERGKGGYSKFIKNLKI